MGCSRGCARWRRRGQAVERKRLVSEADLANIWVTNPTRRLFGRAGPTKLDVAVYYAAVGDFMLPHLFGRPVSLVRCPTGKPADCFFQRHRFQGMPAGVESFETQTSDEEDRTYLTVADAKGYLALAQFGVVEFHTWGCAGRSGWSGRTGWCFDLDPGEGVAWREVVEAAVHVRGELGGRGLVGFAKTTGGKGVHVVVPVTPKLDWKAVHAATGELAAADRGDGAGDLHHGHGGVEPQAADLHRLSPQRPQRRPRWRHIRCARATICRHLRRLAGKISRRSTLRRI